MQPRTNAVIAAMPVEIWDARLFTLAQARAIGNLFHKVWPKPNLTAEDRARQQLEMGRQHEGPRQLAPRAIVVVEADQVVAHAAVIPRHIATEQGELLIAGLARVCTDPGFRGRGLGELVVRTAFGLVEAGMFQYALFQNKSHVTPFYQKLGAVTVANPLVNSLASDPTANPFWDEVVMRYPAGEDWPAGKIDLRGPGY